jgi:hypothetical protein
MEMPNMALNLAPFSRWTLRDKAAQRRLALLLDVESDAMNTKWFWVLFKASFPLSLVLYPLLAIYGHLSPWSPSKAILQTYNEQVPVTVGMSYSVKNQETIASRSYILFPSVFTQPRIITIEQKNQASPSISESKASLYLTLGWLLICIPATWWFW